MNKDDIEVGDEVYVIDDCGSYGPVTVIAIGNNKCTTAGIETRSYSEFDSAIVAEGFSFDFIADIFHSIHEVRAEIAKRHREDKRRL